MTQRLPIPGSDDGTWGNILNGFLEVSHNSDGTLSATAVATALPSPIPTTNLGSGTASSSNYLRGDGTWAVPGGASNATNSTAGVIELTGDLGGTYNSPTVVSSNGDGIVTASGNQTIAGTKTFSSTITGSISGNAATVTTNANLTGPITSVGNNTSIASQTGTGSTFVMSASPALTGTPTAPTGTAGDTSTQVATDAFVMSAGVKGRSATLVVAASNASTNSQQGADYVCTGTNDDATINTALSALPSNGGRVVLTAGDYHLGASSGSGIVMSGSGGITLEGSGRQKAAVVHVPAAFAGAAGIKITATIGCTIRNLYMYFDNPTGVTAPGIWSQTNEPNILNIKIENAGGNAFVIDGPSSTIYNGIIENCEAVYPGSGTLADGFVVTQYAQNCILSHCWVDGGPTSACGLLSSSLTSGTNYTSLTVAYLNDPINSGDSVIICMPSGTTAPATTQTVTASATAAAGSSITINVSSFIANANYTASQTTIASHTQMITRYGFNISGSSNHLDDCHPYHCYEAGLMYTGAAGSPIYVNGGEYETNGHANINIYGAYDALIVNTAVYGKVAFAAMKLFELQDSVVCNNFVDGQQAVYGIFVNFCASCTVVGNMAMNGVGPSGKSLYLANASDCVVTSNTVNVTLTGGTNTLGFYNNTSCVFSDNSGFGSGLTAYFGGTNTGSIVKNNIGLNPFGTQTVSVPSSGSATTAQPFDQTFYVTANASGTTTVAISSGPTITIPASACLPVKVPATKTLTPTYSTAPTWVVEGE